MNQELERAYEKLEIAVRALKWIDRPDHYEPDNYTQVACFQHRAYEALKKILPEEYPSSPMSRDLEAFAETLKTTPLKNTENV